MAEFKLLNERSVRSKLKKKRLKFRKDMQLRLGFWLDLVRIEAGKREIISNRTGQRNPYAARKAQASTAGRLTSRTGKMRHMLAENPRGGWKGRGNVLYKKQTPSFKMQVKSVRVNKVDKSYVATTRVFISSIDSTLASTGGKGWRMPVESKLTLKMRFNWETRPSAGGPRRFMRPSALRNLAKLKRWLKVVIDKDLGGTI